MNLIILDTPYTCHQPLVVNMYILNISRRALKPSQNKGNMLLRTRERERAQCAAETAEQRQERLKKRREIGLGALPRLLMRKFVCCALCIYTLQTCTIYVITMLPINTR